MRIVGNQKLTNVGRPRAGGRSCPSVVRHAQRVRYSWKRGAPSRFRRDAQGVQTRCRHLQVKHPSSGSVCGTGTKAGRNTVTSGGPVTVTVTEPIPCYRSREGRFYVCLASGNQRGSCYRERASVTAPPPKTRPALDARRLSTSCTASERGRGFRA